MPRRAVNGLSLHVQQAGAGPDVILIHGVTGDLSIWFLCRAMQELAGGRRVTAFDLRGHGYSDVPPSGYTSADHAGDVIALMDEIGAERGVLVGHSFGAVIAAHAAVLAPDRVEGIVLSDPYFPALRHLEDLSRWGHWQNFRREAEGAGVLLSDEYWYDLGKFFDQVSHLDEEGMLRFRRAVGLPATERLLRLCRTTCGDDSKADAGLTADRIASISAPVLALYGEASPFLATAEYLADHLPDCRRVLVPGAQHRAPEENPSAFLAAIRSFLDEVTAAGEVGVGR
ncbi:alpha/beta fold hydrolase [Tautonia plasticadhaerens]|uniref:Dihydrolipoyllysine-residue acetyltransferase component of acetoin cleaving system n=1 Tax=Tautonia plasticadhaerens TaxID=2527974 RepID=A0A518H0J9_9BACT|nr:alpha/beta hydrolase [Tautonia plasticadhaerens]QDV34366.1 Dihydrolipoyllysine-residue acetyltransferase component of acetoin cleaving system [Tautonia plasticadhaerens]